ncbi:hypothetical protein SAMN05421847_1288 [Halpernia humi]|uniref:Uncharacterized protein n=1 Tax=Halpernia humi TaxID=493375 RepID=A0A1H5WPS1_9FLAO|nr:hypothetical protein SAMN05421847_1288 [Halpernia humi]
MSLFESNNQGLFLMQIFALLLFLGWSFYLSKKILVRMFKHWKNKKF